jgi:hypothetical protein
MFIEAKENQAVLVQDILHKFKKSTGQLVNPSKCSIMFGSGCNNVDRVKVMEVLQVPNDTQEEKYLGLLTPQGRMCKNSFKSTKQRLAKRLNTWSERFMSLEAKEVLIKSVAHAITTYVMGIFKLPNTLCEDLKQMVRYFWCGDEKGSRKVHWLAWEKLLMPKAYGGMGFRDMKLFNQVLLARQAWRLIQFPNNLCARLMKAKYYPAGELVDTVFPKEVSPT